MRSEDKNIDRIWNPDDKTAITNVTLDPFDVAEFETWLEERAAEGWQVRDIGLRLTDFTAAQPAKVRYRLTPLPRKEKEPEQDFLDMAAASGWSYVDTVSNAFHLWRCEDPDAPEMENDPVAQAEGYRYLARRMKRESILLSVLMVVLIGFYVAMFTIRKPLLLAADIAPLWLPLTFAYFFGGFWLFFRQWRRMRLLLRRLRSGVPMDRPAPWKKGVWRKRLVVFVGIPLYLFIMLGDDLLDGYWNIENNADALAKARYVDVTRLEDTLEGETEIWEAETKMTEIIPRSYIIEHVEFVPDPERENELTPELRPYYARRSRASAETEYYRLWFPAMAREMAREIVSESRYRMEETASDHLDGFWWMEEGTASPPWNWRTQHAVAQLGDSVLYLRYQGSADLRLHTDYLAEVLD